MVNLPSVIQGTVGQEETSDKIPYVAVLPVEDGSDTHHWGPVFVSGSEEAKSVCERMQHNFQLPGQIRRMGLPHIIVAKLNNIG